MAQHFVEFDLGDGKTVLVAAPVTDREGAALASRGEVVERATKTFREALASVRPVADAIFATMGGLAQKPDEVQVELGIALKANASVVLVGTAAEGAIKLVLKWKPG